ncbi:MAG: hypothetical protein ACLQVD_08570 [Capsulimonadaceae bacterium]
MTIVRKTCVFAISVWMLTSAPSSMQAVYAATQNTVFNWTEIPQNQDVPITSAVFDRGGYQLHDTAGETIAIPYSGNSLCALKFARSNTGSMYLVNEGGCSPVLYVPAHGDLQSATVPNARWYPFNQGYDPPYPVYMSIAPSMQYYDRMGWYPGMCCYGGYESNNYIGVDASFGVDIGMIFLIGGHHYDGWGSYYSYYGNHGTNYHMSYYNQQVYGWAGHPSPGRSFTGGERMWAHRTMSGGGGQSYRAVVGFSAARSIRDMSHSFRGTAVRAIGFHSTGARVFRGAEPAFGGKAIRSAWHESSGTREVRTAGHVQGHKSVRTIEHNYGERSFRGSSHSGSGHQASYGGGRSSGGGERRSNEGQPRPASFGGGGHQSFGGGGGGGHQSFGGGGGHQSFGGGGHQSGGGGHQSGGGGDKHRR